jgi:hypothetical protein
MRYLKTYKIFEATKTSGLTPEQEEFLNKYTKRGRWTYDSKTGLVDVNGNFNCSEQDLSDFKGVRFGKVGKDFNCGGNELTTLEGAPQEVGGNFDCDNNRLTSLEGAPQKVGGDFSCYRNHLTTLEGAPQKVGGGFHCQNNQLISLEGAPQKVGGNFYCEFNKLTSLEGAPQNVGGEFHCHTNQLTTLKGAPQRVKGGFWCHNNRLTSLEGAPQKIGGRFRCSSFELEEGEWNLKGWLKVLKEGSLEAQQLIAIILSPEDLNREIQNDPEGMIMKLKPVWNDQSFRETRGKLVWPQGYEDEADLVGGLGHLGF